MPPRGLSRLRAAAWALALLAGTAGAAQTGPRDLSAPASLPVLGPLGVAPAAGAPSLASSPPAVPAAAETGLPGPAAAPGAPLQAAPGAAARTTASLPLPPALPAPAPGLAPTAAPSLAAAPARGPVQASAAAAVAASAAGLPSPAASLEELAAEGRSRFDQAAPARGPPASVPALDEADRALRALNTAGYAVTPAGSLMSERSTSRILEEVDAGWVGKAQPNRYLELVDEYYPPGRGPWEPNALKTPELIAEVRPFVEALTARLEAVLPDGRLRVRKVQIRVTTGSSERSPGVTDLHVDGGYLTVTHALRGPGTDLYSVGPDGTAVRRRARPGETVLVTARDRDWFLGVPSTVHATPQPETVGRVLLLVNYDNPAFKKERKDWPAINERASDRVEALVRRLPRPSRRPSPSRETAEGGLLGWLKRLLG